MVSEVLAHLLPDAPEDHRRLVVDGTVGVGGHAEALLRVAPGIRVLGLDRDGEVLALARERLAPFAGRWRLEHASFAEIERVLAAAGEEPPAGVLLDLGVSSVQLDVPERGFSFRAPEGDADMRFDRTEEVPTALDLANTLPEADLARRIYELGEEPRARAVARALVRARPIADGARLAEVVRRSALRTRRHDPATRTFQALRMAVNDELGALDDGLEAAITHLRPGGRLAVIAYHSLEDRLVKTRLREAERGCICPPRIPVCCCGLAPRVRLLTKRPLRPSDAEIRDNPRARSARLRGAERLEDSA